jgi:hypothetical protein
MTTAPVTEALAKAETRLFDMPVLESFIARREAARATEGAAETANALVHELLSHQSANGSWGGSLVLTAEALLLLRDLRPFDADARESVGRSLEWLRVRQRAPGSWSDVCSPDRHAAALCHHFAAGFFSPGPRTSASFAGTVLATGAQLPTDDDARLAISALALRAVLDYRPPSQDDLLQIEALRRVSAFLFRDRTGISTPAAVTVLATLARAPRTPGHVAVVHGALSRLAGLQRGDGSWPGAEMFHVADALLVAVENGYGSPLFDAAITRSAEMLVLTQQPDGSWGSDAGPYRLLTGWRTLRYVAGIRSKR